MHMYFSRISRQASFLSASIPGGFHKSWCDLVFLPSPISSREPPTPRGTLFLENPLAKWPRNQVGDCHSPSFPTQSQPSTEAAVLQKPVFPFCLYPLGTLKMLIAGLAFFFLWLLSQSPQPILILLCQSPIPRYTFYLGLPLAPPVRDSEALHTKQPTTTLS